jgi:hypothetical protein
MRVMLKVSFPVEQGNKTVMDGTLPKTVASFVERMKPEACYFFPYEGKRTALFFFNMEESSQLPMAVEPFFEALHAEITVVPAMNLEDLKKGLANIPR